MAKRPLYQPRLDDQVGVIEHLIEFEWFPGMAVTQKQKSIRSLHEAAESLNISPALEISSKSEVETGVKLSAFNLMITTRRLGQCFSVEAAFQSSKVFEFGGPFIDLLQKPSKDAKKDIRLKESGNLIAFRFFGTEFPLFPKTMFYDWLYINALEQNEELADDMMPYQGFTDIEFNPKRSINCQAYSAAMYCSLRHAGLLKDALESPKVFQELLMHEYIIRNHGQKIQGVLI